MRDPCRPATTTPLMEGGIPLALEEGPGGGVRPASTLDGGEQPVQHQRVAGDRGRGGHMGAQGDAGETKAVGGVSICNNKKATLGWRPRKSHQRINS